MAGVDVLCSQEGAQEHSQAFGAPCHYKGKQIQDVIAEFMRDRAEKVLGKGCKD